MAIHQVQVVALSAMVVLVKKARVRKTETLGLVIREGSGSYSSAGYIARVESNKVMPQQAVRRGITGTVSFDVTFDSDG